MKRLLLPLVALAIMACGSTSAWAEGPPAPEPEPSLAADAQPGYQGQTTCSPTPKPGALALLDLLVKKWGGSSWGISRGCDVGGRSEHKEGRALDWHMDVANPAERGRVEEALKWLTANHGEVAERLGVMYIIWNQKVWAAYRQSEGWRPMADRGSYTANHDDHVHISLTWDGAMRQTSWWTGVPVTTPLSGPCGLDGTPACRPTNPQAMLSITQGTAPAQEVIRPESLPAPGPLPLIGGVPKVGHLLQVVPGTWVPEGSKLVYQWIVNGITNPGTEDGTYTLTALDEGAVLRVRVLAYVPDGSITLGLSDELPAVTPNDFVKAAKPGILGDPEVGGLLSVDAGVWQPYPTTLTYQWYRDGRPIPGATGYTRDLTVADLGSRITVSVTGTASGFARTTTTSPQTAPVRRGIIDAVTPVVTGERVQGRTLTAEAGKWEPAPVQLRYQWLRDGKPIKSATKATYKLTAADVGTVIRVRVEGSKPGYTSESAISALHKAVQPASTPQPTPTTSPTPTPSPSTPATTPTPTPTPTQTSPTPTPSPSPEPSPEPSKPAAESPTPTQTP